MIRVVVVDDAQVVRQGLRFRLGIEPDLAIVGEAEEGTGALAVATQTRPDVIVLDAMLPDLDSLTVVARLRTLVPQATVVLLSLRDDVDLRRRAAGVGVAVVRKCDGGEALLTAIRRAAEDAVAAGSQDRAGVRDSDRHSDPWRPQSHFAHQLAWLARIDAR